jgi:hypothetical protein
MFVQCTEKGRDRTRNATSISILDGQRDNMSPSALGEDHGDLPSTGASRWTLLRATKAAPAIPSSGILFLVLIPTQMTNFFKRVGRGITFDVVW